MEILVSRNDFCAYMEKLENAYRAWDKVLNALGISMAEDEVITGIDGFANAVSALVGGQTLPRELDADGIMRHCGNDMPLVLWWCWENDFGERAIDVSVGEDYIFPTNTAEKLYDLIVHLNSCTKSESMV